MKTQASNTKRITAIVLAAVLTIGTMMALRAPFSAYASDPGQPTTIVLTIASTDYTVGGVPHQADTAPFLEDGRTLVPLRLVFEALGAEVEWNSDTQTATITHGIPPRTFSLAIGQPLPNDMGTPILREGRTFVPLRYAAETMGASVDWNGQAQTITIVGNTGRQTASANATYISTATLASTITPAPANTNDQPNFQHPIEREVFEYFNANRNSMGVVDWSTDDGDSFIRIEQALEWDDLLANTARWRSSVVANHDTDFNFNGFNFEAGVLTVRLSDFPTPELIVERMHLFVTSFLGDSSRSSGGDVEYNSTERMGVGYDPGSGFITIMFSGVNRVGETDILVSRTGGPYWVLGQESPYWIEITRRDNPFDPRLLLHDGYSHEEIHEIFNQEIFRLHNEIRQERGLHPLIWDDSLAEAARLHNIDPGRNGHIGSGGSIQNQRARDAGWTGEWIVGENMGGAGMSPVSVLGGFATSSAHSQTVFSAEYTHIGISNWYAHGEGDTLWWTPFASGTRQGTVIKYGEMK